MHQPEAWACQRTICFATALSARSASYKIGVVYGNVILCHGAVRTECILLKIELEGLEAFFATALSARSASPWRGGTGRYPELCHGAVRTECINTSTDMESIIDLCHGAVRTECICKSRQTLFVSCAVSW